METLPGTDATSWCAPIQKPFLALLSLSSMFDEITLRRFVSYDAHFFQIRMLFVFAAFFVFPGGLHSVQAHFISTFFTRKTSLPLP
jgi:hypothetical protein